ncbi:MAG: toll/interleukin-1 receptor domain-containing protein [Capsulimonadaceae bacterium]
MTDHFSYDVFLSHSSKDKPTVRALAERLRTDGLRVWFDEWIIQPGDLIPLAIEEGLRRSGVLVLAMSRSAFASDWATLERHTVLFRDPANRQRRFVPLRLDDCEIPDMLRPFAHIDWRTHDDTQYARLLAACRPSNPPGTTHVETVNELLQRQNFDLDTVFDALIERFPRNPELFLFVVPCTIEDFIESFRERLPAQLGLIAGKGRRDQLHPNAGGASDLVRRIASFADTLTVQSVIYSVRLDTDDARELVAFVTGLRERFPGTLAHHLVVPLFCEDTGVLDPASHPNVHTLPPPRFTCELVALWLRTLRIRMQWSPTVDHHWKQRCVRHFKTSRGDVDIVRVYHHIDYICTKFKPGITEQVFIDVLENWSNDYDPSQGRHVRALL